MAKSGRRGDHARPPKDLERGYEFCRLILRVPVAIRAMGGATCGHLHLTQTMPDSANELLQVTISRIQFHKDI